MQNFLNWALMWQNIPFWLAQKENTFSKLSSGKLYIVFNNAADTLYKIILDVFVCNDEAKLS